MSATPNSIGILIDIRNNAEAAYSTYMTNIEAVKSPEYMRTLKMFVTTNAMLDAVSNLFKIGEVNKADDKKYADIGEVLTLYAARVGEYACITLGIDDVATVEILDHADELTKLATAYAEASLAVDKESAAFLKRVMEGVEAQYTAVNAQTEKTEKGTQQ